MLRGRYGVGWMLVGWAVVTALIAAAVWLGLTLAPLFRM
jgi:hypothetical protein